MVTLTYFTCGFCYTYYNYQKILQNKENFFSIFENEFSDDRDLKSFIIVLTITSFIMWPLLLMNDVKNKKDQE